MTPLHRSFPSVRGATDHAIGELGELLRILIEPATATEAPRRTSEGVTAEDGGRPGQCWKRRD